MRSSGIEFAVSIGVTPATSLSAAERGGRSSLPAIPSTSPRGWSKGRRRGRSCSATAHTGWSRPTFAPNRWSHWKSRVARQPCRRGGCSNSPSPTSRGADDTVRGRKREQDALREAFARSRELQACRLSTFVGPAGIGKTRIARELVAEARQAATVAVGRCLSYGEAITYHPLIEIVRQLAGEDPDEGITKLMGAGGDSELVARRMRGLVGLSDETAPAEETFWAVRKLLEAAAAERPLIVVFEDVHGRGPPARPDRVSRRLFHWKGDLRALPCTPGAPGDPPVMGCRRRDQIGGDLGGAPEADARRLVESLTSGEVGPRETARIVRTAEGNPLFLEQLVATGEDRATRRPCPRPSRPCWPPVSPASIPQSARCSSEPRSQAGTSRGAWSPRFYRRASVVLSAST